MTDAKEKHNIMIVKTSKGVTIWVNGRWVLDASLFKEDMSFSVDVERMKFKGIKPFKQRRYVFDKRLK